MAKIKILSFDPGLSATGWAYLIYNTNDCSISIQKFGHIKPQKIAHKCRTDILNPEMLELYKNNESAVVRATTLCIVEQEVMNLVETFKPDHIITEGPFYNPKRPAAYAALVMWITTIMCSLMKNYQKHLVSIAPMQIKQIVGGKGNAGKLDVAGGIFKFPNVRFKNRKIDNNTILVDHESDAIAVGITFIQNYYIMRNEPGCYN
jgi:Holliday junction resolvasome RuvABC endonuclease subunit